MKVLITVIFFLLASTAHAEKNSLFFGAEKAVSYDISSEWKQSEKPAAKDSPTQSIRLKKNDASEIQITFVSTQPDSPIATDKNPIGLLEKAHKDDCQRYISEAAEGNNFVSTKIESKDYVGYISTFTHKNYPSGPVPAGLFRHVTRITLLMGPKYAGVIASITILSQDTNGQDYKTLRNMINSLKLSTGK
jgi:hypothetical protein